MVAEIKCSMMKALTTLHLILLDLHSSRSSWRHTPFGLPQGSVLLYILFTADIDPLLASWSLASHSYADDVQSYKHCSASRAASAIRTMSQATDALNAWMSSNRLLLNPHKTQYIWLGTRQQLDPESLSAEFPTFLFSTSVRDLGVILDQELSFGEHITALTLLRPRSVSVSVLAIRDLRTSCLR